MKKFYLLFLLLVNLSMTSYSVILLMDDYKYDNYSINSLSPYYHLIKEISGPGEEKDRLYYPQGMTFDTDDDLYIADSKNGRICKYSNDTFEKIIYQDLKLPVDVEYSVSSGTLFITDEEQHSIVEIDTEGNLEGTYGGTLGYRDSNLSYPSGIFLNNGNIYVTDRLADNIKSINKSGVFKTIMNKSGKDFGALNEPGDIWFNSKGWLYITNYGNDRVEIFNPEFYYSGKIGERGINISQFRGPYGITGDLFDNIFVCDSYNGRVQKFDEYGTPVAVIGEEKLKNPKFCIVDDDGLLYVSDVFFNKIFVFSPKMFEIGRKHYMNEEYEKAVRFLNYAIKIDKKNQNAYYYLAFSFFKLEKYHEVMDIHKSLKNLAPGSRAFELTDILVKKINKWEKTD